jgi:outer membrane lipoprotein-sorting protein
MKSVILTALYIALVSLAAYAQTADEIVSRYIQKIGGMDKISAIKTVRSTGKFIGGGGFEAIIVNENKRPDMIRNEFSLQGMTAVSAYDGKNGWKINPFGGKKDVESMGDDGKNGWKINPFGGKKDVESMGDEELKQIIEAADIDGPLINAAVKGNKLEYLGKEEYEGSDVFKVKVTLANGTLKYFYFDTDYYVPIKIETKRMVRGSEVEFEQILGDYKEAGGVYFPFSIESGPKGGSIHSTITLEKIEINPVLDDSLFRMPNVTKTPAAKP